MRPETWYIVLGLIVFSAIGSVIGAIAAKKRREEMQRYAASRGWTYVARDDGLVVRFEGTPPFGRGFGRRAYNVIHGRHDDRAFVSFDYSYKTRSGSGKKRRTTTHHFSVLALSMGQVQMPELYVRPQGLFDAVVDAVVDNDIDLESEDFNRAFTVTSTDRRFASDVLHPRLMEFLLQHPDLGWRLKGDSMLAVGRGKRTLGQIDATLVLMDAIGDQVPDFVWAQLRGGR